ncbi:MAG TPA: 6,7-dimethyl-8-ribityllumazine synthase [Longimicrobiales bacterium]|nr:6,7-dimethyl-8-ribityllumazine synthase [Longimicrobiales bacterium]
MTRSGSPGARSGGGPEAAGLRVALLAARFNPEITDALTDGARRALLAHGAGPEDIETIRVPGAWERPQAAAKAAAAGRFDAVVALGCVIRGETPHFEYVCMEATLGLGAVARAASVPVAFGVLTTDDVAQARARAGEGPDNKGYEAAMAVLEMVSVYRMLRAD